MAGQVHVDGDVVAILVDQLHQGAHGGLGLSCETANTGGSRTPTINVQE